MPSLPSRLSKRTVYIIYRICGSRALNAGLVDEFWNVSGRTGDGVTGFVLDRNGRGTGGVVEVAR